jgi:hypothetical protein
MRGKRSLQYAQFRCETVRNQLKYNKLQWQCRNGKFTLFLCGTTLWKTCPSVQVFAHTPQCLRVGCAAIRNQADVRGILDCRSLNASKDIARVKGQFTVDAQHFYCTVDGIDVHQTYRARCGFHQAQEILVTSHNPDEGARLVELGD